MCDSGMGDTEEGVTPFWGGTPRQVIVAWVTPRGVTPRGSDTVLGGGTLRWVTAARVTLKWGTLGGMVTLC